jgi:GT2 family glycosyltransferase
MPEKRDSSTPSAASEHHSSAVKQRSRIAVLIVNWNTRKLVLECLDSLPSGVGPEHDVEVVVIDNGSVDGSGDALAERDDIQLLRNEENLGYAAAVNQAYRCSTADYVLLLNSDVAVKAGSLSILARFLDDHPRAAAVGPLYLNPDGSPQPFNYRLPTFKMTLVNGSSVLQRLMPNSDELMREYLMLDDDFSVPRPVEQPAASCLLLRRSSLDADAVLDERFPIFFNDVQLARKLAREGWELWVTPEAVVVHEAHSSSRMLGSGGVKQQYLASVIRMLEETESRPRVWLYRSVVFPQNLFLYAARRPTALRPGELWQAMRGNPGPLPRQPKRA